MSNEQETAKGHKSLENILAMFDDEEDENFQQDRSKLYSAILVALKNTDKSIDPLIQIKILNLSSKELVKKKELDAPCAVSAISVINALLKYIQENKCEMVENTLVQSALAVTKMLKHIDGRCTPDLMKLTVDTYITYPNDTFAQLISSHCKNVLGLFLKPEINFTLMTPVLVHLLKILPDDLKTKFIKEGLDVWFYPFLNYYPNIDVLVKNIDVLELLTDHIVKVDYSNNNSWLLLLGDICDEQKYPKLLKELLLIRNGCWYRLWIIFIKLLKDQITKLYRNTSPINSLLPVVEQAFKMDTICRNRAFECWNALIDNFSKDLNGSLLKKRLNLLIIPLKLNNARVSETILIKMNTWWNLICKFHSRMESIIDTVLLPFLYYCFGNPEESTGGVPPGQTADAIALNCVEALIEIIGHDNCEGCVKLPRLKSKLLNTQLLVGHWGKWLFFLNVAITTLSKLEKDNADQQLRCLWNGFITTLAELSENQIRVDLFNELLKMIQTLLDKNDIRITKSIFNILILSLFEDKTKQLLRSKAMHHVDWGPIPTILTMLQHPVMARYTDTIVTEDLIAKVKSFMELVINPHYSIPETLIEWFLKNPPANQEKIPIWAALAESVCETRYQLTIKNVISMLLWPVKYGQKISQERCEAVWHRWYNLHKSRQNLGDHYYSELEKTLRVTMAGKSTLSNMHFMMSAAIVLLENKLNDDSSTNIENEMQILLEVLENVKEAKLDKLIPILVAVLAHPKNLLLNKEIVTENIVKIVSLTVYYINQLIENSAIADGTCLIENLLPLIDNIVKPSQYPQLCDNLVDQLIRTLTFVSDTTTKETINKILTKISLMKENRKANSKTEIAVHNMETNSKMDEKQSDSNFQKPKNKSAKQVKKRGVADVVNKINVNGEEYEIIKSNWKFNPKKLTEAQKEKLKRKRDDIPALYQDLSQSQEEISLKAWKTDSQETSTTTSTSTSSKTNSKSTDNVTQIIHELPGAAVVPRIIETMLSDTANKTKVQSPDNVASKLESPIGEQKLTTPKSPKTPRIALKDRIFRNVRNLIEQSGLNSPDKSPKSNTVHENVLKTPVTKTKTKSIATDSDPIEDSDNLPNSPEVITHTIKKNIRSPVTETKTSNAARSASVEKSDIPPKLTVSIDCNVNENVLKTHVTETKTSNAARSASFDKSDMPPKLTESIGRNVNENILKTPVTKTKTSSAARSASVDKSDMPPKLTENIDRNANENVLKTPVTKTKTSNAARSASVDKSDIPPKLTENIDRNANENILKTPVTKTKTSNAARSASVDKSDMPPKLTESIDRNENENILKTLVTKTKTSNTVRSASVDKSDMPPKLTESIDRNVNENILKTPVTKTKTSSATRSASFDKSDMPPKLTESIDRNVNENILKTPVTKTKTSSAARSASVDKSDMPPKLTENIDRNANENVLKTPVTKTKTSNAARSASVDKSDIPPKLTENIDRNANENILKTPVTKTKTSNAARSASVDKSDMPPKLTESIDRNENENVLKTLVTKTKTSNTVRSASVDKSDIPPKLTENVDLNVNKNILETPVTTKTKSSATNTASSERPSRSIKRPKKFENTKVFDLRKRRRSVGESQQSDKSDKKEKDSREQQAAPEEPTLVMKEPKIIKEQNNKATKLSVSQKNKATELTVPQPSVILEQPHSSLIKANIVSCNNEVSSSQIESFNSCETQTQEENKGKSYTIQNESNNTVEMPEENMVDNIISESQAMQANDCSQANEAISTPKLKTKKTKNEDQQSVIKKKRSRIEKQLLIDTNVGYPLLQSHSTKRTTRNNTESKRRKSLMEKTNKLKSELELHETDISKQKSCDNSQIITSVESEEEHSTEDFPMSEDVIESSQDSTLTTISVKSTSKKKVPYVMVEKLSPENKKSHKSSESIKHIDDASKVTPKELSSENKKKESPNKIPLIRLDINNPLANCSVKSKRIVDITQKLILTESLSTEENKDDLDFTKNKSADGSNENNLTETMATEPMDDSVVMIINDEDAPIVVNTEEISVGKETQELAEADTLPMELGSQSINGTFNKEKDTTKKAQIDSDITNMTIQNDGPEESITIELADVIGESSNSDSPFKDNIQRKKDFLNDTIEISPIKTLSPIREKTSPSPDKNDEYVVIKLLTPVQSNGEPYTEKCDSPEIFTDDKVSPDKMDQSPPRKKATVANSSPSSSLSLKKNRPQMRANGRAAQMLGLCVPEKLQILNPEKSESEEVRRGSPLNTRAKRNLRILYNSAGENVENENAVDTTCNGNGSEDREPFLKLKRTLPTTDCSPSRSILKRKLAEIADETTVSPANKNMVTQLQLNILLEFLENHRDMAKGRLRNALGRHHAKELWEHISATLNSVEGCRKTSVQWQTVWRDRKYMAKKAAADLKNPPIEGSVIKTHLHRWERRVLDIIGFKYTDNPPTKRDLVTSQSVQELQLENEANQSGSSSQGQPDPSGLPMDLSQAKESQDFEEDPAGSQYSKTFEKQPLPKRNTCGSGQEKSQLLPLYAKKSVLPHPVQESPKFPPPPPPQSRPVNLSMKNRNLRGLSQGTLPLGNSTSFMDHVQEAPMGLQTSRSDVAPHWMKASTQGPAQYASSFPGQFQVPLNGSSGNPNQGGTVAIQQQQPFIMKKKGMSRGMSRKYMQTRSEAQGPYHSNSVPFIEPSHNGSVPLHPMRFFRPHQSMAKRNHTGFPQDHYQGTSTVPSDGTHMNQVPFVNPSQNGPLGRDQRSHHLNQFKDRTNSRDEDCLGALRHRLLRMEEERLSETRGLKEELSGIRIMLQTLVDMSEKIDFI